MCRWLPVLMLIAGSTLACAPSPRLTEEESRQTVEVEAAAEARHDLVIAAIRAEAAGLNDHPWAGSYYEGDGLGFNGAVHVAPAAGFAYTRSGCLGVYGRNTGTLTEHDGELHLVPTEPETEENPRLRTPTQLRVVRWGERTYLIPPDRMVEFCNEINGGGEPRLGPHGSFLLRGVFDANFKPAELAPVTGLPDLPDEFRQLLLRRPLAARITRVGKRRGPFGMMERRETEVEVDVGRADGVFEGMELHAVRPQRTDSVRITEAGDRSSTGVYEEILPDRRDPRPAVGWELSTRMPWALAPPVE